MNARTPAAFRNSAYHLARMGYTADVRRAALVGEHDACVARELGLQGVPRVELEGWGPGQPPRRYDLVVADLSPEVLRGRAVVHSVARLQALTEPHGRAVMVCGGLLERSHRSRVMEALKRRFGSVWSCMEAVPGGGYRIYVAASDPLDAR
jgi:hypothetical protein